MGGTNQGEPAWLRAQREMEERRAELRRTRPQRLTLGTYIFGSGIAVIFAVIQIHNSAPPAYNLPVGEKIWWLAVQLASMPFLVAGALSLIVAFGVAFGDWELNFF